MTQRKLKGAASAARRHVPAGKRQLTAAQQTEQDVRQFFEARGWQVTKLDRQPRRAADFSVCDAHTSFLCEVKTIESARASLPYTPLEYNRAQRQRRRDEIDRWLEQHPEDRLLLRPDEREYIYGAGAAFEQRYGESRRNTEAEFEAFADRLREHLAALEIASLPYTLRLDSDDLYAPDLVEQAVFFKWLEDEIAAIHQGCPGWDWQPQPHPLGWPVFYSARYRIHKPAGEADLTAEYSLTLEGPHPTHSLEVEVHGYGTLNLQRISDSLDEAVSQLAASASRQNDKGIPRIVVLALGSSPVLDEWTDLASHLT